MFSWLTKKRDTEIHKRIENMHSSVHNSFSNIKKDMSVISVWIKNLHNNHHHHNHRIEELEKKINYILTTIEKEKIEPVKELGFFEDEELEEEPITTFNIYKKLETLTPQQYSLFRMLSKLNVESGSWISFKDLAAELYPSKEYSRVRSTISEYLGRLEELGLVERKRIGKNTHAKLSPKAKDLVSNKSITKAKIKKINRK